MSSDPNRRRAPRVPRHIMVRYCAPTETNWKVTTLRDFSLGGARLLCDQKFEVGSTVILQFGLPIFDPPISIDATVCWVQPFSGAFKAVMHGVAFPDLEASVRQRIAQTVENELRSHAMRDSELPQEEEQQPRREQHRYAERTDKNFSVHVRVFGAQLWSVATLRDISLGGAKLIADGIFSEGDAIEIKIGMPLFLKPVVITAHMLRKASAFKGNAKVMAYGVAFDMLPNDVRQVLTQKISSGSENQPLAWPMELREEDPRRDAARSLKRLNVRFREKGEKKWKTTFLRNLSAAGAQFVSDERFDEGTVVQVSIPMPHKGEPLECCARILWREGLVEREGSLQRYGVVFEFDSPKQEKALLDTIAQHLEER